MQTERACNTIGQVNQISKYHFLRSNISYHELHYAIYRFSSIARACIHVGRHIGKTSVKWLRSITSYQILRKGFSTLLQRFHSFRSLKSFPRLCFALKSLKSVQIALITENSMIEFVNFGQIYITKNENKFSRLNKFLFEQISREDAKCWRQLIIDNEEDGIIAIETSVLHSIGVQATVNNHRWFPNIVKYHKSTAHCHLAVN